MQIIEKGFRLGVSLDIVLGNFLVYKFLLGIKVTAGQPEPAKHNKNWQKKMFILSIFP